MASNTPLALTLPASKRATSGRARAASLVLQTMRERRFLMKTSKHETVDGSTFRTIAEAGAAIGSFIDEFCDSQRLHSALHYPVPSDP